MAFKLITTQEENFESKAALEHYIKEHAPLDFDQKVDLLKDGKIVIDEQDAAGDFSITIEAVEVTKESGESKDEQNHDGNRSAS